MRRGGASIGEISRILCVSKGSVSIWCDNIILTKKQKELIKSKMVSAGHKGRLKGAETQKRRKEKLIEDYKKKGLTTIRTINNRDLLIIGIGLYLGEGNKTGNKFQFTNSNPDLIGIVLFWLSNIFFVKKENIILNVIINEIHTHRECEVLSYWSGVTKIPLAQFNKTIFIKSKNKKVYDNMENHFGTLIMRVKKSSNLQYQIMGLCFGSISKINDKTKIC